MERSMKALEVVVRDQNTFAIFPQALDFLQACPIANQLSDLSLRLVCLWERNQGHTIDSTNQFQVKTHKSQTEQNTLGATFRTH